MHLVRFGACLVLVLAACGGENLTLAEYATQGGAMTAVMEERIAALDADWLAQVPTVARVRAYWDERLRARRELLEQLDTLNPPNAIAAMHRDGLDLFGRLITAEQALAARVTSFETATEPEEWWSTAEAAAVDAVNEEILALCLDFQARYDATIGRTGLSEMPWIPAEMKEIVSIDVGCE